jgi:amino acid adenylation domain-containing protein
MAFSGLHEVLFKNAKKSPQATALRFGGAVVSYAELCKRAAGVSHALQQISVGRSERVAILMNRGFESYAAIFGSLHAGACYGPLDAAAPPGRIVAVLQDSDASALVVDAAHASVLDAVAQARLPALRAVVCPSEIAWSMEGIRALSFEEFFTLAEPEPSRVVEQDLALIFYTSGSTGKPKGVAHSHRSMLSNVEWALEEFEFRPTDRFANVTSHHFDLCWLEMFASFAVGAELSIIPESLVKFPFELATTAASERISVWCSVPSTLVRLVERGDLKSHDLSALRWVLFAGERFPVRHLSGLMQALPHPQYCNMYGTTETHIAAYHRITVPGSELSMEQLPIGRGCSHVELAIVGKDGRAVPPGESGELAIRGPSVMEGYWGMPERTALVVKPVHDVSLPSRFAAPATRARTERVPTYYHTGDIARMNENGDIELFGRGDRRVKLRGNLVDLDEIEAVLQAHEQVKEAAAFLVGENADAEQTMYAAVVPASGFGLDGLSSSAMRHFVAQSMPLYSVPERVIVLHDMPRTGSGKTDRVELRRRVAAAGPNALPAGGDVPSDPLTQVRRFIVEELSSHGDVQLEMGTDLIGSGIIESMGVVRLVEFLEQNFGVQIANDAFTVENFQSLDAIVTLLDKLRGSGPTRAAVVAPSASQVSTARGHWAELT